MFVGTFFYPYGTRGWLGNYAADLFAFYLMKGDSKPGREIFSVVPEEKIVQEQLIAVGILFLQRLVVVFESQHSAVIGDAE
jgi:hypothetical protein